MARFIKDMRKFHHYVVFQAKSDLKAEVASSYLNWVWWVLDPLFYMLIYSFVSVVVFRASEPYFPVFVFIGLSLWEFFNRMVMQSTKIVAANKAIVTKVYVPKYILVLSRVLVNGFKMAISFLLVFGMMALYRVPPTWGALLAIPITLNMVLVTFGICTVVAHFGVFVDDLQHVMEIILKFLFYFTGIFYAIENRIPGPYSYIMLRFNPVAYHIHALREALLYGGHASWGWLLAWTAAGVLCGAIGIRTIYRYENTYVKTI